MSYSIIERTPDSNENNFTLEDIKPENRLKSLLKIATVTLVDPKISIHKYLQVAESLLAIANIHHKNALNELGLLHYTRYIELIKKMKKHPQYTRLSLGIRSSFGYKAKAVLKIVKELTQALLEEYKKVFNSSSFALKIQEFEGLEERRPTVSTIKTFVSVQEDTVDQSKMSYAEELTSFQVSTESLNISKSKTETIYGIRRTIFTTKQVKEFDSIHKQRRSVRSHRTLKIPSRLTTVFSYLSFKDMKRNVETVGYLAGKEQDQEELIVSHLILPQQLGFSDSFKVYESHNLIRYLESNDLMILGWIHSHPVERSYLSSTDMHYQSIIQSVIPEAVAMVYSPKEVKCAIFNLTPDYGLRFILKCREKGFHVHPTKPPITMVSQHAITDLFGDLTVRDFRNKKNVIESDGKKFDKDFFEASLSHRISDFSRLRKSDVVFTNGS